MKTNICKLNTVAITMIFAFLFASQIPVKVFAEVTLEPLPDTNVYGDFVVGPGKFEFEMSPGETKTIQMTVANRLGQDRIFTLSEEDFTGSNDPNHTVVLLGDDRGPYSLKDYVSIGTTSIMIRHGEKARIPIVIHVPVDAEPGGLYGSVIAGSATKQSEVDASDGAAPTSAIITRIGTLLFVRVKGPVLEKGHLDSFVLAGNKSLILEPMDLKFQILYKNEGNVNLDPYGTITITNILGSNVGTVDVDPWFAMPQSLRFREVEWKQPFLFGRYVARAEINRGYGNATDTAEVVFWVIPWKIIVAIIAVLIIIIGGVRFITKRFKIVSK